MNNYRVKMLPKVARDLDEIYLYIASKFNNINAANRIIDAIEEGILSLSQLPHRGSIRKTGKYANIGYRQLFIKKYTIIYRVNEQEKNVIIVTVRYSPSQF